MSRPRIRPPVTDDAAIQRVCDRLAIGMSMLKATEPEDVPRNEELYCAMARDEALRARIARARKIQQDALVDQMQDLSDSATPDDWQVKRLQIWTRQWMAAKLQPKTYGDKLQHTGDGGGAVNLIIETGVRRSSDDDDADATR